MAAEDSNNQGDKGRPGELLRRSYRLSGHKTSLSLERTFWDEVRAIAQRQNRSITALLEEIDQSREDPLSRAVRLYVLEDLRRR